MNDLQLHRRLSDLADDLSPGDHPYELAAGARSLHRRRRRTRVALGGAAVAVALVAVGVPTIVSTLSAPDRGDVAAPTPSGLPSEGPEGAAEELRPWADAVRAAMADRFDDGFIADPEDAFPCPDVADALSRATGMFTVEPTGINAGGGTLTGCGWSTDPMASTPAEQRLDLSIRAAFDMTTDDLLRELDDRVAEDDCSWTALGGEFFDPLMLCDGPQQMWTLTVLDEDGVGAWVLMAAIGAELPEGPGSAAGTLAELWRGVRQALLAAGSAVSPPNREFIQVSDALSTRRSPVSLEETGDWGCRSATLELPDELGLALMSAPGTLEAQPGQPLCGWAGTGAAATLSLSINYLKGADDAVQSDLLASPSGDSCYASDLTGTPSRTTLQACSMTWGTAWRVVVAESGGNGLWLLEAQVPSGSAPDGPTVVLALVDVADQLW